jgi:recombinational DNA repair protein RecT
MSNALALTTAILNAPQKLHEVFEIEAFKHNCVANYEKTTGKKNGALIFERERILFFKTIQDNPKLEKCSRLSIYSAFVELFASGRTLNEGDSFIIPYGERAQFQIGWKGRLEQISQIPGIHYVNAPQVVYNSEVEAGDFEYTLGEDARILKHKPNLKRGAIEGDFITHVYLILDTAQGKKHHLMTRSEVLHVRDRFSQGYKQYIAEIAAQKKTIGEKVVKKMRGKNGGSDWELVLEPPFWVTDEAQAFKKTLVKRVYGELPKTPRLKAIDARIANNYDPEDGTQNEETHDIDYNIADDQPGANGNTKQITEQSAAQSQGSPIPQGDGGASQGSTSGGGGNEKPKRSHKKKDPETKAPEPTATTPDGTTASTETGEVMNDNPVDDLPDLGDLN